MPKTALSLLAIASALSFGNAMAEFCPCNADFFPDGFVNLMDFAFFVQYYHDGNPEADINCDGAVNLHDYAVFQCQFLTTGDPTCCEQAVGACCLPDGISCVAAVEEDCLEMQGSFAGPGTECSAVLVEVEEPGGEIVTHQVWTSADCESGGLRPGARDCPPGEPFHDSWTTPEERPLCHNFGVPGSPAIPPGFFGPGSDPFEGQVCMKGEPLGIPDLGDADTIIERTEDPFDRCELPGTTSRTVDAEVVALSLVGIDPIEVIIDGLPVLWDVAVDLSEVPAPVGFVTATRTHCNGGTYTSTLYVQPRFTFTRVDDPAEVRVLDTGLEGIEPVMLDQLIPEQWASDLTDVHGAYDPCTDFHAGIDDNILQTDQCDCNGNGIRDRCDIENGDSPDCNLNQVPDGCDIQNGISQDANGDGIPDECCLVTGDVFDSCRVVEANEILFGERYSLNGIALGPPGTPVAYDSTWVTVTRVAGTLWFVSGSPDTLTDWICDGDLYVNSAYVTTGWSDILDPELPLCRPMEEILAPVPPINVTAHLPHGTNCVSFELVDVDREIYGNTEIYLVKREYVGLEDAVAAPIARLLVAPNPASAGATLRFMTAQAAEFRLDIFDAAGRLVRSLPRRQLGPGEHSWSWDARDQSGERVGAGAYYYVLKGGRTELSGKILMVR